MGGHPRVDKSSNLDWSTPLPRDVFMEHFAARFADLGLTPGQVTVLLIIGGAMSFGRADEWLKLVAGALEDPEGDECRR